MEPYRNVNMRYGRSLALLKLALWAFLLQNGSSMNTLRKHQLSRSATRNPAIELSKRVKDDKDRRYLLVSCIGAITYDQRRALNEAFELDEKQSAALSGKLKPRCDLWELEQPQECRIILDVDIPMAKASPDSMINNSLVSKLLKLSNAVVVHLNPQDIRQTRNSLNLSPDAKRLLEELGKGSKSSPQIYVILPDASKFGDGKILEPLRNHIMELMGKRSNVHIEQKGNEENVYNSIKQLNKDSAPKDIAKALATRDPNDDITNSSLVHLKEGCFAEHYATIKSHLSDIYRGKLQPDFGSILQASFLDAALSYYLLTLHLQGEDLALRYLEQEYKRTTLATNDAYLRILMMAETEAKSKLRKELSKDSKQDTDALVNEIMTDFERDMERTMSSPLRTFSPPEWLSDTVETMKTQLREKLESIVIVHLGLPRTTVYADQEKAVKRNHEKKNKQRGVSMMLSISAMLRERGYGNRQGYINYHYGPLVITLGYANDRDVAEAKPGTGIMTPAFRIQPQLHVNVAL